MICKPCAWEADVRLRVRQGQRQSLPRRKALAMRGHAACRGCDCQHKEPGRYTS